ncbi:homoserine O-succinyltransferase [Aerococcaceae bacterium WGS1372]
MPIKLAPGLPIRKQLEREGIVAIDEMRARKQDIRPLKILILNLMPKKESTELQLLRLLGNTPLQIEVDFLYTQTYEASNTPQSYLEAFYKTYDQIKEEQFDGLIITGAPVEHLRYKDVSYINELDQILQWAKKNVFARVYICWGAQYALYHDYGIDNVKLNDKLFGIFDYQVEQPNHPLLRGFNDFYQIPQSRHTTIDRQKVEIEESLEILTAHPLYGPDMIASLNYRDIYLLGHMEYDRLTLHDEFQRDLDAGKEIKLPENYYPNDHLNSEPTFTWRSSAHLFYNNWLNEVYQHTYYDLTDLFREED